MPEIIEYNFTDVVFKSPECACGIYRVMIRSDEEYNNILSLMKSYGTVSIVRALTEKQLNAEKQFDASQRSCVSDHPTAWTEAFWAWCKTLPASDKPKKGESKTGVYRSEKEAINALSNKLETQPEKDRFWEAYRKMKELEGST